MIKRFLPGRGAKPRQGGERPHSEEAESSRASPLDQQPRAAGHQPIAVDSDGPEGKRPEQADSRPASPQALVGVEMPNILFNNFDRRFLDLGEIAAGGLVLYVYPGCEHSPGERTQSRHADTVQHRTYSALRKRFAELMPSGAIVAVSSISPTQQFHQSPELAWDQDEDAPFQHYLVSDEALQLAEELELPTFRHQGETYYERLALVACSGRIQRVFHPVTPGQDARQALAWLQLH
jgi:peroxiredoxin